MHRSFGTLRANIMSADLRLLRRIIKDKQRLLGLNKISGAMFGREVKNDAFAIEQFAQLSPSIQITPDVIDEINAAMDSRNVVDLFQEITKHELRHNLKSCKIDKIYLQNIIFGHPNSLELEQAERVLDVLADIQPRAMVELTQIECANIWRKAIRVCDRSPKKIMALIDQFERANGLTKTGLSAKKIGEIINFPSARIPLQEWERLNYALDRLSDDLKDGLGRPTSSTSVLKKTKNAFLQLLSHADSKFSTEHEKFLSSKSRTAGQPYVVALNGVAEYLVTQNRSLESLDCILAESFVREQLLVKKFTTVKNQTSLLRSYFAHMTTAGLYIEDPINDLIFSHGELINLTRLLKRASTRIHESALPEPQTRNKSAPPVSSIVEINPDTHQVEQRLGNNTNTTAEEALQRSGHAALGQPSLSTNKHSLQIDDGEIKATGLSEAPLYKNVKLDEKPEAKLNLGPKPPNRVRPKIAGFDYNS